MLILWAALMLAEPTLGPPPATAKVDPVVVVPQQVAEPPAGAPIDSTTVDLSPVTVDGTQAVDAAGPMVINLAQALTMGLAHDRNLRISGYQASSARQGVTRAWSVYQPQINLDASARRFDSATTGITSGSGASANENYGVAVHAEQLIFDLGQGLFDIYRSRQVAKEAGFSELATELSSVQRIATNFFGVLRNSALVRLASEVAAQSTRLREEAEARLAVGRGSRLDVLLATVTERNAAVDLSVAQSALATAEARVRQDLGLTPGTPFEATADTQVPPVELSLVEALELTDSTPTVQASEANRRAQLHAYDSARIARWATLRATGSYDHYLTNSRGVNSEYVLGGTLSLPLWDGLAGAASQQQARLAWLRAKEQVQAERERVRLEIEQAHAANVAAVGRLDAAQQAAELAAQTLSQTEESYRLGAASQLEVGDARTEYQRAQSNLISAQLDRDLSAVDLRVAVGRLPLTDAALLATSDPILPPAEAASATVENAP